MKRTKKNKLIVWALGLFLVGVAGAYVAGKIYLGHRAKGWKRDGIAASIAGDHERAASLLARVVRRDPDDVDALTYYVKSRELAELPNGQHFADTLAGLKLLIVKSGTLENRRHLLELYAKLERRPEALDTANAILASREHPEWANDVRTLQIKTDVLQKLGQNREALDSAKRWAQLAPLDINAHMARLTQLASMHEPPQSIVEAANALRLQHPNDPRFELVQGYAYAICPDLPDAYKHAQEWTTTAAAHPDLSDDVAQQVIAQFDKLGMPEKSLATLQDLVKRGAGPDVRHALARRFWEIGKWDGVVANLADVKPEDAAADPTLLAIKVISLADLGQKADADAGRAALASRKQATAKAWDLLLRRIVDAAQIDDKQAVALCQSALMVDSKNAYLYYYLGDADARLGETDRAIGAWGAAERNNSTWSMPGPRLVDALMRTGKIQEAQDVAQYAMAHSHSGTAAIALAQAYASADSTNTQQTAALGQLVDEIQQALPGEERTLLIRIEWLDLQGRKPDAVATARAAIHRQPAPGEQFLLALAAKSRQYQLGLERECFAASQAAHGTTPALAYARAVDQFLAGGKDDALKQFDDAARQSGKADTQDWRMARAQYLDFTFHPAAKAAWVALGDAYPKDLHVQQAVIDARAVQGDWDVMQRAIGRLKDLTGEHAIGWRLATGRLQVLFPRNPGDREQGSIQLSDLLKEDPGNVDAHVLLARALVQMKRIDGAIEHLSKAADLDKTSIPIALQLAALLQSRGDFERVQHELDRITPAIHTPAQRQQAAALLAQQGNAGGALQLLEHPTTRPGETPQTKPDLLLAELYRRRHEFDKAEGVVRQLMQHPDLPTVRFAATFYAKQGRRTDADAALAQLDSLKLEPGIRELALGSFYADTGDLAKAIEHYKAATVQAPANPVGWRMLATTQMIVGRANESLATLHQAAIALPGDQPLDALDKQADLLRQAGTIDEARAMVVHVMKDPLNAAIGLELLRTLVEAQRSNDVQSLASRLQQFVERHPEFLPGQLQLVQCLASIGRIDDALSAARRAASQFPNDPDPVRVQVQLCAATGRWADMETAAQAWRSRLAEDPMPADLAIARAKVEQRQYDAALAQLQPYESAAAAEPDRFAGVLMQRCVALARSGRIAQVAETLWPLTAKSAAWRLQWVRFASEIADPAEAARWIDRVVPQIPANATMERVTVAEALDMLGLRFKDGALEKRADEAFAALAADPKAAPVVLLAAAAHAERMGDAAAAEPLYRKALAQDPNQWIAQNNLAMLIVRRGGDPKEAAACAAAAARLQPRQATILDTLAQVQAKAGDPKAAAQAEHSAMLLDPDNAKWRVRFTQYLVDSGQVPEAKQSLRTLDASRTDFERLPPADQLALQKQLDGIRARLQGVKSL